jgi:hypothetical protein
VIEAKRAQGCEVILSNFQVVSVFPCHSILPIVRLKLFLWVSLLEMRQVVSLCSALNCKLRVNTLQLVAALPCALNSNSTNSQIPFLNFLAFAASGNYQGQFECFFQVHQTNFSKQLTPRSLQVFVIFILARFESLVFFIQPWY